MLASTEKLLDLGMGDQIIKERDIACIFDGTPAKRYALVHKALNKQEILRLCRGNYVLGTKYRSKRLSQFFIANRMVTGGFISFETALAFHNWIPERVTVIMSVIPEGRTRRFSTGLGEFEYIKVPFKRYEFLSGVVRSEINGKPFLIATPLRALADYVYLRKINWTGLNFLLDGMRIEMESLASLTTHHFDAIMSVYASKRVLDFLQHLRHVLGK